MQLLLGFINNIEMKIKIFDNFLKETELSYINNFTNNKKWVIQISSKDGDLEFLYLDVSHEKFFNSYLFNEIKKKLDHEYVLEKIYFNGQWPGRDGSFHKDPCKLTALFYVNPYNPEWGGFTQFLISPTEQYIIPPIQNRLITFPGDIAHKAYSYSNQNCPMRISLAYKLL